MGQEQKEVKLSEANVKFLTQLAGQMQILQQTLQNSLQIIVNEKNLEGNWTLSPDFTTLVKVDKDEEKTDLQLTEGNS